MSDNTKIEYVDATWNPITGCSPISEGCQHCYAQRMARRLAGRVGYKEVPHHFDITLHPERFSAPLAWKHPRRIFVCSMSDLFHPDVPDRTILDLWHIMAECPQHQFLLLTKRPERMKEWIERYWAFGENIWAGVTGETEARLDERMRILLSIKADLPIRDLPIRDLPIRGDFGPFWASLEPMLEPISVLPWLWHGPRSLDWVVCGGETGSGARPMHANWARAVRDECKKADIPFFFKQMSGRQPTPGDLLVREYPADR